MAGGEIFIPKNIPSMKITDMFDTLVPSAKRKIIGMRAGERLHEILLTQDEARHAIDYENYFVILPEHFSRETMKKFDKYFVSGKKLPDNFSFSSDKNTNWLTGQDLRNILNI